MIVPRVIVPRTWDDEVDVLVVGFGAAGASAAIDAAAAGADVLVVDRFDGGGSTALSGGVIYLGGGTPLQRGAGVSDDPENMAAYLRAEAGDDADADRIRRFCDASPGHFEWLEKQGVVFPSSGEATKTSYPPDDCSLYYSGNELCSPFRDLAKPAPRGHRVLGSGLTGSVLFEALRGATLRSGVQVRLRSRLIELARDEQGRILGAELLELPPGRLVRLAHRLLQGLATYAGMLRRPLARPFRMALSWLEVRFGRTRWIRTRGGVVLCTGGFGFDGTRIARHAPEFVRAMPLGTAGDDGGGMAIAESAGAATRRLDRVAAWRFFSPPEALVGGLLVDARGRRFCNEELYGARLGEAIAKHAEGRAWLVIDGAIWTQALRQIAAQRRAWFQRVLGLVNLFWNRKKAGTLEELAHRCGMSEETLLASVDAARESADAGTPDAFGKSPEAIGRLEEPPFYAVRCDLDSLVFPTPCMTLGGLATEAASGSVLRADGTPIAGLYAAGRCASGIASWFYVSGLSIADCIDSGRTAGLHAAESVRRPPSLSRFR
jgi:3-oxo-5alpha-steroid 4-dehydrogenase